MCVSLAIYVNEKLHQLYIDRERERYRAREKRERHTHAHTHARAHTHRHTHHRNKCASVLGETAADREDCGKRIS